MRKAIVGALMAVVLAGGCAPLDGQEIGLDPPGDRKAQRGDDKATGTNPLDNPDGTEPGLAPITSEKDRKAARELIEKVGTKGRGPKTGYDREEFGYAWADNADDIPYARNGCDTRNDILQRDGEKLKYRDGSDCVVVEMTIFDPYTDTSVEWRKEDASEIQIDHIMPLSYDWQMGASRWTDAKRKQISNDPLNLLAVDGSMNSSKGDSGPASWLPPTRKIRCAYVVRFAQVALKYDLPVTAPDKAAMLDQCA
ncbi:lipoprotein [Acrocarpospora phusangensis]|uniref:Lipoprotein n=1 Tax=Acrocarpospora phusangensis TaxID=1070424 RepID=A0A919UM51_9ACTN|nr:HNH endonuclease family protein [Acrocarpospora phusangensis]GIH26629.1 lipoprotein [Acrocarpospora phusangensis]